MQHPRPAILVAQARVGGADVEEDRASRRLRVGQRQEVARRGVHDHEARRLRGEDARERRADVLARPDHGAVQGEAQAHEAPRRLRVAQTEFGAAQTLVLGDRLLVVERDRAVHPALQVVDGHHGLRGGEARGQEGDGPRQQQARRAKAGASHRCISSRRSCRLVPRRIGRPAQTSHLDQRLNTELYQRLSSLDCY